MFSIFPLALARALFNWCSCVPFFRRRDRLRFFWFVINAWWLNCTGRINRLTLQTWLGCFLQFPSSHSDWSARKALSRLLKLANGAYILPRDLLLLGASLSPLSLSSPFSLSYAFSLSSALSYSLNWSVSSKFFWYFWTTKPELSSSEESESSASVGGA